MSMRHVASDVGATYIWRIIFWSVTMTIPWEEMGEETLSFIDRQLTRYVVNYFVEKEENICLFIPFLRTGVVRVVEKIPIGDA